MVIDKKSPPSPTPKGPRVEMNEDALLEFLEEEMVDATKLENVPRILAERR